MVVKLGKGRKKMERRTKRKLGQILLAILFTVSLLAVGCGKKEGAVKEYENVKEVTLRFFGTEILNSKVWNEQIQAKDGTQIKILETTAEYYTKTGGDEAYRNYLVEMLDKGNEIDWFSIFAEDVFCFTEEERYLDLSDLKGVENLSEDALRGCSYDGKVFGIPLIYVGYGFYWNQDMLDSCGLEVPSNLEEFLSVCRTLKEKGYTPYLGNKGYSMTVPAMAAGFAQLYASEDKDEQIAKLADGTTPVSTYMKKGFELVEQMRDEGIFDIEEAQNKVPNDSIRDFAEGKGACFCGYLGADVEKADFKMVMTGVTVLEDGAVTIVTPDRRVAINPKSENLEYAREALEYVADPKHLQSVARELGTLCAVDDKNIDYSYIGEEKQEFIRLVSSGNQIPVQDFSMGFNTWIDIRDLCREIVKGKSAEWAAQEYDRMQKEEILQWK